MTTNKQSEEIKMTYHIYSLTSGQIFATTDDVEFLQRELAYLIARGYNVAVKEGK